MDYVDGFVAAVPTANRERYTKQQADLIVRLAVIDPQIGP